MSKEINKSVSKLDTNQEQNSTAEEDSGVAGPSMTIHGFIVLLDNSANALQQIENEHEVSSTATTESSSAESELSITSVSSVSLSPFMDVEDEGTETEQATATAVKAKAASTSSSIIKTLLKNPDALRSVFERASDEDLDAFVHKLMSNESARAIALAELMKIPEYREILEKVAIGLPEKMTKANDDKEKDEEIGIATVAPVATSSKIKKGEKLSQAAMNKVVEMNNVVKGPPNTVAPPSPSSFYNTSTNNDDGRNAELKSKLLSTASHCMAALGLGASNIDFGNLMSFSQQEADKKEKKKNKNHAKKSKK